MAEALTAALNIIDNFAVEEGNRLYGLSGDIDWIQGKMRQIQAYLKDADSKPVRGQEMAALIENIRDLGYDMEDVLETFLPHMASYNSPDSVAGIFFRRSICIFSYWSTVRNFAMEIAEIRKRIEDIGRPITSVQVVGWPPVRAQRKKIMLMKSKYVKVGVDGAPYLRKVDLQMYNSYDQLLRALEGLFTCFTIRSVLNEKKLMDPVNGVGYVPTYEDKDGDWMLVGDVPWEMFAQSCKRLRLMTRSEAIGLGPGTPPKCSSSSC